MFDPVLLRSLAATPLRVQYAVLPVPAPVSARVPGPEGAPAGAGRGWAVLRVTLHGAGATGAGEATLLPYAAAHGHDAVRAQLAAAEPGLTPGVSPLELPGLLPPGPARSAVDSALWDLFAERSGLPVRALLGLRRPRPLPGIRTLPLLPTAELEAELRDGGGRGPGAGPGSPGLRLRLGAGSVEDDLALLDAVRRHRPDAWLMADADGAWDPDRLHTMLPRLAEHGVRVLRQPLPEAESGALVTLRRPFPIIAGLAHGGAAGLDRLAARYDGVALGLDAVGGLTTALAVMEEAGQRGLLVLLDSPPATARSWTATLHAAAYADLLCVPPALSVEGGPAQHPRHPHSVAAPPAPAPAMWG
ncbi:enolase C-terminal domain-like protein [Streptomyces naganishii]|uniref:Dipeptide epimerase n=1 Tax=Streptomyces naganishii JCM 4654 TaxID=1306179 RepID=A0A918Y7K1_9ACTN|nr:enolase C-terminal domain-like protein [Streptomyces naganishii]GHD93259.1 dipeptide epimerase [Streptomyces naganishii JCM 4654]